MRVLGYLTMWENAVRLVLFNLSLGFALGCTPPAKSGRHQRLLLLTLGLVSRSMHLICPVRHGFKSGVEGGAAWLVQTSIDRVKNLARGHLIEPFPSSCEACEIDERNDSLNVELPVFSHATTFEVLPTFDEVIVGLCQLIGL